MPSDVSENGGLPRGVSSVTLLAGPHGGMTIVSARSSTLTSDATTMRGGGGGRSLLRTSDRSSISCTS